MNLILTKIVHKTKKMNNLLQIQGNVCSLPDCHYHLSLRWVLPRLSSSPLVVSEMIGIIYY